MAFEYVINPENRLVRTTFSGQVTRIDVANLAECLRREPAFDPEFSEIILFSEGELV